MSGRERVYRTFAEAQEAAERNRRDKLIDEMLRIGHGEGSRGGRPREVTLPMIRQAMAELVNGKPPKAPTQEAVQNLRGWDRKTIRARAREFPGGWVALRQAVEAAGE